MYQTDDEYEGRSVKGKRREIISVYFSGEKTSEDEGSWCPGNVSERGTDPERRERRNGPIEVSRNSRVERGQGVPLTGIVVIHFRG